MKYNPDIHHRRSIRLKGYDYTRPGAYFITICTQNRECLFGEVVNGEMRLNGAGAMVQSVWDEIPAFYPGVLTDAFVVMPNHIHGIVILVGAALRGRPGSGHPQGGVPTVSAPRGRPGLGHPQGGAPTGSQSRGVARALSLPDVVHRFKTLTTKRYVDGVKRDGWPPFPGRLWQRNYYEHIIRDEQSLNRIRQYIADNPARWALDRENPDAGTPGPEDAWLR